MSVTSNLSIKSRKPIILRALKIALFVGLILNVINNSQLLLFNFEGLNYLKIALTFLVPFCVSFYSSVQASKNTPEAKPRFK